MSHSRLLLKCPHPLSQRNDDRQQAQVLSALRSGDLVYVRGGGCAEGIYSFGCAAAFGPILLPMR